MLSQGDMRTARPGRLVVSFVFARWSSRLRIKVAPAESPLTQIRDGSPIRERTNS